jgi:hypothetical protein
MFCFFPVSALTTVETPIDNTGANTVEAGQ